MASCLEFELQMVVIFFTGCAESVCELVSGFDLLNLRFGLFLWHISLCSGFFLEDEYITTWGN